jgi:hypoxanthine phosphoribosyltransferase
MEVGQPAARPAFAHASEAELARILDFYQVRWRYEPDTFPIGWNLAGEVVESFAPDFYLPDFDLYVELTTLKQKLVRKKNRKLRRLRELYPDVQIKLFYAHDFRMLLLKFGRLALIGELSGTTGQATPPRVHVPVAADEVPLPAADGDEPDPVDAGPTPADGVPVLATATPRRASSPRGRRRGRRRRTADAATSVSAGLQAEADETPGIA